VLAQPGDAFVFTLTPPSHRSVATSPRRVATFEGDSEPPYVGGTGVLVHLELPDG
jgi:hypothetical protein